MPATVLLTGFGAFLDVASNPTATLARRLNGRRVCHHTVVGRVLPVSYEEGLGQLARMVNGHRPTIAVGLGVHRGGHLRVEVRGHNRCSPTPDVEGECRQDLGPGPESLDVQLPVDAFVAALGATTSTDAGSYLCNAWLYTMLRDAACPSLFVHVPPAGMSAEALLDALPLLLQSVPRPRLLRA